MEQKSEQTGDLIRKDMLIGEVVQKHPYLTDTMASFGFHCMGCHVNVYETLEQGAVGHGMSQEIFNSMMVELNQIAAKKQAELAKEDLNPSASISVTHLAAEKIKGIMERNTNAGGFLKVSAMPGGCAGYMYGMEMAKQPEPTDAVFEQKGIQFIMDQKSAPILKGLTIDYVESLQGAGFKFLNPNAKSSCGCGQSFH